MLVRQLANIAFGFDRHGQIMAISAHYDGSGKEEVNPIITVGGFFADDEICRSIEQEWLRATGGAVFHLADFGTKYCKLGSSTWTLEERVLFLKRLGGIVNRPSVNILTASVEVAQYRSFSGTAKYAHIQGPPYSALASLCSLLTERTLSVSGLLREQVAYVFEKGEREHELTHTFTDFEKGRGYRYNLRSHHFLSKDATLLQVADLISGTAQKVLVRAHKELGTLDNGRTVTPFHNFVKYYSRNGVTAAVMPPLSPTLRCVVANKSLFESLDTMTSLAIAGKPSFLHTRMKQKTNQGKSKRSGNNA
jgi:hypothetical protein